MTPHICQQGNGCLCYILALEPNEECPVHGYPYPPRCCFCGRFYTRKLKEQYEKA